MSHDVFPEKRLHEISPGQSARIVRLSGRPEERRRLLELGFTPGTVVTVRKKAPFGDPVEMTVRSYEVTMRSGVAETICVSTI